MQIRKSILLSNLKHYANSIKILDSAIVKLFSSARFTWVILILFILQSLWVSFSYYYSPVDETFHIGIVQVYTNHLWPVIYDQPLSYDVYRDFAGEGSKLYHFLLSFPLRVIQIFTTDTILQVKLLRFINVIFMTAGLWVFARLLLKLKIDRAVVNVGLIITTSLPITSWIAGTVNYDNLIMLLTPTFLYSAVLFYRAKRVTFLHFSWVLLLGLWASLVKFTFLPIFVCIVLWLVWSRRKQRVDKEFFGFNYSYGKALPVLGLILILLIPTLFLFAQTYGVNMLAYGTPRPDCRQTLGVERCVSNSVIQYNEFQESTKSEREVESPGGYLFTWVKQVFYTSSSIGNIETPFNAPMPIYYTSLVFFVLLLLSVSLANWGKGKVPRELKVFLVVSLIYIGIVFLQGLQMYYRYHAVRAVTFRYVLPILIIVLTVLLLKFKNSTIFKKVPTSIWAIAGLLVISQGGGIISHVVMSDSEWYWEGSSVTDVNIWLRDLISVFLINYS